MNFKIIFSIFCFLLIIGCAYAGDNNTTDDQFLPRETPKDPNIIIANESGHFNTSFSDGSNGYCLEYGEKEAVQGDKFYKVNTSYAINNIDNKPVGDYLKTFFIDYYDVANKDKIATQHYIWAFTDNFKSWRIDQDLVDYIKLHPQHYPDNGVKQINNTTQMLYQFSVLLSEFLHHQNYFTYKISFQDIDNNSSIQINNSTTNNSIVSNNMSENNASSIYFNQSNEINQVILSHPSTLDSHKIIFMNHITGSPISLILICILLIITIFLRFIYAK